MRRPPRSTLFPNTTLSRSRMTREAHRGRGRPARRFHLTDAGRATFPHAYDDLALTALRYVAASGGPDAVRAVAERSEEHTSELQSRQYLVCRLLLEKTSRV